MTTLVENCRIPPESIDEVLVHDLSLPLTYLDLPWLHFHPIQRLLFYEFPCSKSHFLETLIPKLKHSLSLTLNHYLPLAGNLLFPSNTNDENPVIRYVPGDSVSLTISESSIDFENLVGNQAREADQFYDFVPQFPQVEEDKEYKRIPVLSLQITLFPDHGICIGFANHHSIGDASSIFRFITTWASINKLGGGYEYLKRQSFAVFDKSIIKDPHGIGSMYWNIMRQIPFQSPSFPLPTKRVRSTFFLNQSEIKKLKERVLNINPGLVQVSSFVAATAYIWTCFVKSGKEVEDKDDDNRFLFFAADCRERMNPPLPDNYFGNCLSYGKAKIGHGELAGREGFVLAAMAMAEDIKNIRNNDKGEMVKRAGDWMSVIEKFMEKRAFGVSGSPKFDLYGADFGWGRVRKVEIVSIDGENYSMSLYKSGDGEGGLEIGLSLPKDRMDIFAAVFEDGLRSTTVN